MSIFSTFTQHDFRSPSCGHQRTEEIKGIQVGKEVKLALFADDMMLDIEKPQVAMRKPLELINELVKLQDTKLIPSDFLDDIWETTCCFLFAKAASPII